MAGTCAVKRPVLGMLSVTTAAFVIGCMVTANVGADMSATLVESGSNEAANDADSDGATVDGAMSDADGTPPPVDAGCDVNFPQEATFVNAQTHPGIPPNYVGGAIVAGTYALTAMNAYTVATAGTVQIRETLRVRGPGLTGAFDRLTEAQNPSGPFSASALHGESSSWRTPSGSFLFETPQCPAQGLERGRQFTAQGDTLSVLDLDSLVERIYQRLH